MLKHKYENIQVTQNCHKLAIAISMALFISPAVFAADENTEQVKESGIEKIIVTSERRSENIQEMGTAIATISGETLLENGMSNLVDAISYMPAVEQQQSNRNGGFYVRGIGSRFPGVDTSVATYSDGVFQSRGEVTNFSFVDVDRIEVLRGPQGTLYGRNSIGGAVNIVTNNPDLEENSGSINAQMGNYSAYHFEGVANVVLGENTAVRIVAIKDEHDGYLDNGLSDADTTAVRIKLLTKPADNISILLGLEYFKNGGKGIGNGPISDGFAGIPYTEDGDNIAGCGSNMFADNQPCTPHNDTENLNVYAEIDIDLDWATLSFLPAYQDFTSEYGQIFGTMWEDSITPFEQKSMEVRLVSNGDGNLEWVTGLYWFESDGSGQEVSSALFGDSTVELSTNESQAIYGQATYKLSDDLRIVAGLRYTQDEFGLATTTEFETLSANEQYSKTTWSLGVEYDVADESLLFAKASTGFKQGGASVSGSTGNVYRWDPETIMAYEFGSKNRFNEGNVQLNLSAFYYIWEDYIASAPVFIDVDGVMEVDIVNGNLEGETTIYGLELEGIWLASDDDRFDFSVTLNRSAFADTVFNGEDLDGRTLNHAPEFTASIAYSHSWELADTGLITAHINAKYNDGYWLDIQRSGSDGTGVPWHTAVQSSYVLLGASLRYEPVDADWWLSLYGSNLTNELIYNQANPGGPPPTPLVGVLSAPRTFGISATYNF